jgi:tetratricopeptide (TPR) repeat protein
MQRLLALPLVAASVLATACQKPAADSRRPAPAATNPVSAAPSAPVAPRVAAPSTPPAPPRDTLALAHNDPPGTNHLARADRLHDEGDTVGALAEARKAVADDGQDVNSLEMVAQLAKASGQVTLAAEAFERLGRIDSEDAVPLVQAARMRLAAGAPEAAEVLARTALCRDDENVEAWQALGRAQLGRSALAAAIESLEQARTLAPSHGWVLNNLGFAYLRANRNAEALEVLERAAELLPEAAVVHNNFGVARERTGDLDGARQAYARSTVLAPRYLKAQINGQRTAMARTGTDGGMDEAHVPADDDADD